MQTSPQNEQWFSDDFKSSLMLAIALHLFLIMSAFIVGRIILKFVDPEPAIEIIQASVRVDVVGMPKMTLQELKALESLPEQAKDAKPVEAAKVEEAQVPVKPDDVVMPDDSKPAAKKSFTDLLNDYSTKKIKLADKAKNGEKSGKILGLDSLIIEGNRLSKGTALTGTTSDMADSVFVGYVQTIPEKVREHWRLPGYLKEQNLKCRIHIWIGLGGEIIKLAVRESSGNAEFDSKAEAAIRAAAPFAAPPVDAAPKIATRGVVLGFPL